MSRSGGGNVKTRVRVRCQRPSAMGTMGDVEVLKGEERGGGQGGCSTASGRVLVSAPGADEEGPVDGITFLHVAQVLTGHDLQ